MIRIGRPVALPADSGRSTNETSVSGTGIVSSPASAWSLPLQVLARVRNATSSRRRINGAPTDIATTVLRQPREPALDQQDCVLQLTCALNGTDKFAKMPELERDHIFKMLEADDRPGLETVVEAGNPLRSFATGLKVGKQLIEKRGVDSLPSTLREPLSRLKVFYEDNRRLVELGDKRGLYPERARTVEDVAKLRHAFGQAQALLDDLRLALDDNDGQVLGEEKPQTTRFGTGYHGRSAYDAQAPGRFTADGPEAGRGHASTTTPAGDASRRTSSGSALPPFHRPSANGMPVPQRPVRTDAKADGPVSKTTTPPDITVNASKVDISHNDHDDALSFQKEFGYLADSIE